MAKQFKADHYKNSIITTFCAGCGQLKRPALSKCLLVLLVGIALIVSITMAGTTQSLPDNSNASPGDSSYIVVFDDVTAKSPISPEDRIADYVVSHNGKVKDKYSIIKGMAVTIPDDQADVLRTVSGVRYVEKDEPVQAMIDLSALQIGAQDAWVSGYTGKGVKICIIDSGVDIKHPDLKGKKVIGWIDLIQNKTAPYDDYGHGTHVSSIVAGTGKASKGQYKGIAYEASLLEVKALNMNGKGNSSDVIKGIEWAVMNGAQVISLSLGTQNHTRALDEAVNNAINANVTVVASAGNYMPGVTTTITCPGDNPNVITVGACDRNDNLAVFSMTGPTYDGHIKPDLVCVGTDVISAKPTWDVFGKPESKFDKYYSSTSGTSMATPMTAGVIALMLQKYPDLTPAQVKDILTRTAKPLGSDIPNNATGYGRVNATAAMDYLDSMYLSYGQCSTAEWYGQTMPA